MNVDGITSLISNIGFPIFVALFMMIKQSKDFEAMKDVLSELKTAIELLRKGGEK